MLSLHTSNLDQTSFNKYAARLPEYLEKIHNRDQGFYSVIDDEDLVNEIETFAEKIRGLPASGVGKYTDIVILGIGGSALGMQTVRDSLRPLMNDQNPKLHIVDNIDPDLISAVERTIDLKTTLFLVITKSGGTAETLSLYSFFRGKIEELKRSVAEHFVFITDPTQGFLREVANRDTIRTFPVPPNVGGRFSVLTAVGLLPAAFVGINIRELLKGAQAMRDRFISENSAENFPFQLAAIQYELFTQGKTNVVMMPYVQRLKTFADWYKQLLAESTGKIDANGNHTGLTPMAALGVTDQHSQLQQFTQGLNDKQFLILRKNKNSAESSEAFAKEEEKLKIPSLGTDEKVSMLAGLDFATLLDAECQGTIDTLTEENRPNYEIRFDEMNAETLGAMFLLFEGATAFLGEFLNINAFDQPGVERSKILTREYLEKL